MHLICDCPALKGEYSFGQQFATPDQLPNIMRARAIPQLLGSNLTGPLFHDPPDDYPDIRLFTTSKQMSDEPLSELIAVEQVKLASMVEA